MYNLCAGKKGIKSRDLEINIRKELGIEQQILNPKEIHDPNRI